ncbi:MAG: ABC transporter permease [Acidimicrobiales bacterium]
MRALAAHLRLELALLARNGESLLLTLGIPVVLLVFFANVDVLPIDGDPIDFLAPGVLALAILSTAFVNLAIGVGFEREYGVLKRLGATPLGRPRLLGAKTLSLLVVEALQVAILWPLALALGWDPAPQWTFALAVALGTVACAGLGLCLAGSLRALVVLAAANGLYLVLLLLSGMVIPLEELPDAAQRFAKVLPSAALAEVVRGTLTSTDVATRAWLVLTLWAIGAPVLATRLFRWE